MKCENSIIKMNNTNGQLKLKSEVRFQLKVLELLLYIPQDKSWSAQLHSWLKEKTDKYEWCKRWIASAIKVKAQM